MGSRKSNFGWASAHLSNISFRRLTLEFFGLFVGVGTLFGVAYWGLGRVLPEALFSFNRGDLGLMEAIYFSFITQLTVGYGDLTPLGWAQPLGVLQGILGVLVVGLWAGVFVAKWFTSGDKNSIYFADWACYSLAEERFFVLFVNRNVADLVDANINAVLRIAGSDPVTPHVNPPYIGRSAWMFGLQRIPVEKLTGARKDQNDGIKVSIAGTAGMTRCTSWKRYRLGEIYVLPDRKYYWQEKFISPRFDDDFYAEFSRPLAPGCEPFLEHDFLPDALRKGRLCPVPPSEEEGQPGATDILGAGGAR